jgi:hypothetical protein
VELSRTDGWEARLEAVFTVRRSALFDWSSFNCVQFAGEAVSAITGRAVVFPTAPSAVSALEAARALESLGGLEAATSLVLGAPHAHWKRCRRGDVALLEHRERPLLTVCTGRTHCAPGPNGLEHLPLKSALKIWRVG